MINRKVLVLFVFIMVFSIWGIVVYKLLSNREKSELITNLIDPWYGKTLKIEHYEKDKIWIGTDVKFKGDRIEFVDEYGAHHGVGTCYVHYEIYE